MAKVVNNVSSGFKSQLSKNQLKIKTNFSISFFLSC